MSPKVFAQVSVLILFLLAFLGFPLSVQAGGVCGGAYTVEQGQTLDTIAAICGTTASAIIANNPGISGSVSVGQVPMLPGSNSTNPNNTNTNNSNTNANPPLSYTGTYIVQRGDTFSGIASRFGVSIYALWAANPFIWNVNVIYTGQVLNVPTSSRSTVVTSPTTEPVPLSYGVVPPGAPYGRIKLSNRANADVYVSLQGTTRDGFHVINEYPVSGAINANIPAGWYIYVAWIGGRKFEGQFKLGGDSDHTMTFYINKVVVE